MTTPLWLVIATRYLGTAEVAGVGSNPKILQMASRIAVGTAKWIRSFFKDDDIPWCALFVNNCLAEAGLPGTGSLAARSFETYGRQLLQPRYGCILVFDGGRRGAGSGHVGFYVGQSADNTRLRVRGGNQNNAVSDTWIKRERLLSGGMRWPFGVNLPDPASVVLTDDGQPVSTSEE